MLARRHFLAGFAATAVLGFNPVARKWVSVARADSPFDAVPRLDGVLLTDAASRAADAVDVGNIVHLTPVAVLRPGSVDDIIKMVLFCRRFHIKVAARGQGHTTSGQSQVENGLVIEMSSLNKIHSIGADSADVDAGVLWKDLLAASVALGLTPPALTGFIGLSIGGTLSVGGISASYTQGAQVDNVRELEVITGEGELKLCSPYLNPDLFQVVLAGLGQCAIITRAVVNLVPAKPLVRVFQINYTDNATFFRDMRTLVDRDELRDILTLWAPDGNGGFVYGLTAAQYFDPASPPDATFLLRGLSVTAASVAFADVPYQPYALRVDTGIDQLKAAGLWDGVLHPWFDVFLPAESVEAYVGQVIPSLAPDDVGAFGFMLLFPHKPPRVPRSFLRLPEGETVFLFDILTSAAAPGPEPAFQTRILNRNRTLFEKARDVGGTRYPIGSIPFDHADWIRQYGEDWPVFVALKQRFDPDGILTPGPGIFPPA